MARSTRGLISAGVLVFVAFPLLSFATRSPVAGLLAITVASVVLGVQRAVSFLRIYVDAVLAL